ncbi:hypothetical protein [Hyphomicrobium sp. 2TAF46]|uniref:hypothetical protein n=1 Tax=Hyphomicrobium sp. 2TAF46 TaxID=3233019 RepID=UPI003F8F8EFF
MIAAGAVVMDRRQYLLSEPVPALGSARAAPDAIWERSPNLIQNALGQLEIFRLKNIVRNEHVEQSYSEKISVRLFCAVGNPSTWVNAAFAAVQLPA